MTITILILVITMKEELIRLNELRQNFLKLNETLKQRTEEFDKQNQDLYDEITAYKRNISNIEEELKQQAIHNFEATGLKQFTGGVKVQVRKEYVYDKDKAFSYAKEHNFALKLDDTAFKKLCSVQDIEFVEKKEKVIGTIPKEIIVDELR